MKLNNHQVKVILLLYIQDKIFKQINKLLLNVLKIKLFHYKENLNYYNNLIILILLKYLIIIKLMKIKY